MNEPLPPVLCPHGWRKFEQAQKNMMRQFHKFTRQRTGHRKTWKRWGKWARTMNRWLERIYSNDPRNHNRPTRHPSPALGARHGRQD